MRNTRIVDMLKRHPRSLLYPKPKKQRKKNDLALLDLALGVLDGCKNTNTCEFARVPGGGLNFSQTSMRSYMCTKSARVHEHATRASVALVKKSDAESTHVIKVKKRGRERRRAVLSHLHNFHFYTNILCLMQGSRSRSQSAYNERAQGWYK
jgi:hypothetical protein